MTKVFIICRSFSKKRWHQIILSMKFSFLLLFAVFLNSLTASVKGQNETFKINVKNVIVRDVLKEVESKTNYRFFFSDNFADIYKTVSIDVETNDVTELLSKMFQKSTVTYKILDNGIVVITPVMTLQQGIIVTGVLTDESGATIPGANVLVKGTTTGVTTDMNGKYTIAVPNENAILQFSFLGYDTKEVVVGAQKVIDMTLTEGAKALEEVVVVAPYSTVSRKSFAGAAEVVNAKQIGKTPVASLAQSLQGNAAGVMVATTQAEPGADVYIRIRGNSSMNASNEPLVLIDNVPSTMTEFTAIDPSDVLAMSILKDAASTALYGSRASNGIIMVTTRRGQKGTMRVTFSGNYSFNRLQNVMDVMDGQQFATYANLAYWQSRANQLPYMDLSSISNNNFQKLLTRNGYVAQGNLQISGGGDKVTYFISGNYAKQAGLLLNTGYSRMGLRANFKADLLNNLTFTFNSNVSRQETQTIENGDSGAMIRLAMMNPIRYIKPGTIFEDGYMIDPDTGQYVYMQDVLPGTLAARIFNRPFNFSTSGEFNWTIIPGLTATTRGSVIYRDQLGYRYDLKAVQISTANSQNRNRANRSSLTRMYWLNENFLNYNHSFNNTHNMSFMLGQSAEKTVTEGFGITVYNFPNDYYTWNNLSAATNAITPSNLSTSSSFKTMVSFWAKAGYSYLDKYFVDFTYRADGSSRFGSQSKWGYFPSVGVRWNAKNEDFLRSINPLTQLSFRLSWGKTGNDGISQGTALSFVGANTAVINGATVSAARASQMGNADIRWEMTQATNFGLDVGVFNDVVVLSFDAYYKKTKDLLYRSLLPYTTGFESITSNIGSVENKGIELTLTTHNITRKDFSWTTNVNFSWNANKVLDLGGDDMVVGFKGDGMMNASSVGNGGAITYFKVGQPMCIFMGYPTTIWQSWDEIYGISGTNADYSKYGTRKILPGLFRYWGSGTNADGTPNGTLTQELNDFVILGHTIPDYTAGFTNTFTYKDFELTCFFTAAWGHKIFNGNSGRLLRFDTGNNEFVKALDCYRSMNVMTGDVGYSGKYPAPVTTGNLNTAANANPTGGGTAYPGAMNETWLEDGAYLRLKTLSLTYNVPKKICGKIGMSALSISGNAMNLWTLTRYSGMDPEMNSTQSTGTGANDRIGVDRSSYPASKTYTINLNIQF